ncbi:MAG: hypothetical protein SGILL_003554 [Bacillariaceae sp.]
MSESSDDGDYAFENPGVPGAASSIRYPVHDCAEFEDAETLRHLILRPVEDSDDEDDEAHDPAAAIRNQSHGHDHDEDDDSVEESAASGSSSSDEAASPAAVAAHAAAIGHSPQPLPAKIIDPMLAKDDEAPEIPNTDTPSDNNNETEKVNGKTDAVAQDETTPGSKASVEKSPEKDDSMEIDGNEEPEDAEKGENGDSNHEENDVPINSTQPTTTRYYCPYNLNERDSDENTPLHVAIHARRLENVKVLLEAGASVHKRSDGSPPLHAAISVGSVSQHADFAYECVKVLDEHDADLAGKDDSLQTPLYLACMYNLPRIVSYLLSREAGKATLNTKADRSQGRALHASAKFNTATNTTRKVAAAAASAHARAAQQQQHHHPDGSVASGMHHIPGFPGKQADRQNMAAAAASSSVGVLGETSESTTLILLKTEDVEIDAQNSVGQTPLHVACSRGNWNAVRELLNAGASPDTADRRGYTPGQFAHKRGVVIPNDLLETLGGPPSSGIVPPPRDLIVDPDSNTLLITHELCILHRTCPPIRRDSASEPPPENVRRLQVLVDPETGILRTGEFSKCNWQGEARRAALVDVLKVNYISSSLCESNQN